VRQAAVRLRLKIQLSIAGDGGGINIIATGRKQEADNHQQRTNDDPRRCRRQRIHDAKMIRGVPDFRQGRFQFKSPGHGFPPAPRIFILS
jgi:hypothetical protein